MMTSSSIRRRRACERSYCDCCADRECNQVFSHDATPSIVPIKNRAQSRTLGPRHSPNVASRYTPEIGVRQRSGRHYRLVWHSFFGFGPLPWSCDGVVRPVTAVNEHQIWGSVRQTIPKIDCRSWYARPALSVTWCRSWQTNTPVRRSGNGRVTTRRGVPPWP